MRILGPNRDVKIENSVTDYSTLQSTVFEERDLDLYHQRGSSSLEI